MLSFQHKLSEKAGNLKEKKKRKKERKHLFRDLLVTLRRRGASTEDASSL